MQKRKSFKLTFTVAQLNIIRRMMDGEVPTHENISSCVRGIKTGRMPARWPSGQVINKAALDSLITLGIVKNGINKDASTCVMGYICRVWEYALEELFEENTRVVTPAGVGAHTYL